MKLTLTYSEAQDKIAASHNLSYDQVEILGNTVTYPASTGLVVLNPITGEVHRKVDIDSVSNSLSAMLVIIGGMRQPNSFVNKIELIKSVRNLTGWGLKDAKDFVERYI